jgi:hypothetical protein
MISEKYTGFFGLNQKPLRKKGAKRKPRKWGVNDCHSLFLENNKFVTQEVPNHKKHGGDY